MFDYAGKGRRVIYDLEVSSLRMDRSKEVEMGQG